jgi:hypothetical protein
MARKARRTARRFRLREDPQLDEREVECLSKRCARTGRCADASQSASAWGSHRLKSLRQRSSLTRIVADSSIGAPKPCAIRCRASITIRKVPTLIAPAAWAPFIVAGRRGTNKQMSGNLPHAGSIATSCDEIVREETRVIVCSPQ